MFTLELFIVFLLVVLNSFTVYKFIFNKIFIDEDDFNESVKYFFVPDIIYLFKGKFWKNYMGKSKFIFFIILCVLVTAIEYWVIDFVIQSVT